MFKNALNKIYIHNYNTCIHVEIDVSRLCCVCCAINMAKLLYNLLLLYKNKKKKLTNC